MNRLLIYGLGVSGIAAARLASYMKIPISVWDDSPDLQLPHDLDTIPSVSLLDPDVASVPQMTLMASPGISEKKPMYQKLLQLCGQRQLSEVDFGLSHLGAPTLGVTGTNGKSTCCAMIQYLFKTAAHLPILGNFGYPVCEAALLAKSSPSQQPVGYILELSSFQLAHSKLISSPVCVFTNFAPDHLSRHGNMSQYFATKWRIIGSQKNLATLITTEKVIAHQKRFALPLGETYVVSQKDITYPSDELKLLACHATKQFSHYLIGQLPNLDQKLADALQKLSQQSIPLLYRRLEDFGGLCHRMERLKTSVKGVLFINDSKSTNLHATTFALSCCQPDRILLILGGLPKSAPQKAALKLSSAVKCVVIVGEYAGEIQKQLDQEVQTLHITSLDELLGGGLMGLLEEWQIQCVLFSPGGCSSDQYPNFQARGEHFKKVVDALRSA